MVAYPIKFHLQTIFSVSARVDCITFKLKYGTQEHVLFTKPPMIHVSIESLAHRANTSIVSVRRDSCSWRSNEDYKRISPDPFRAAEDAPEYY